MNEVLSDLKANSFSVESARQVNYDSVEINGDGSIGQISVANSETFNYLYYDAAVGCAQYLNP